MKDSIKRFRAKYGKCPQFGNGLFGGRLIVRNGKYGKFLGCSNYPDCTFTQDLKG